MKIQFMNYTQKHDENTIIKLLRFGKLSQCCNVEIVNNMILYYINEPVFRMIDICIYCK